MEFLVRAATNADVEALSALELEARSALVDARGGRQLLAEQPAVEDWASVVDGAEHAVWVATIGDVVVGYLQLRLPARGGIGKVMQVFVLAGAREVGFGDELLATAVEAIVAAGGTEIESFALPGDRDTKNLYERAGITARKLIVSKRLD
jgi:ribosomal protein S18 acetylase RimI-like enzyme